MQVKLLSRDNELISITVDRQNLSIYICYFVHRIAFHLPSEFVNQHKIRSFLKTNGEMKLWSVCCYFSVCFVFRYTIHKKLWILIQICIITTIDLVCFWYKVMKCVEFDWVFSCNAEIVQFYGEALVNLIYMLPWFLSKRISCTDVYFCVQVCWFFYLNPASLEGFLPLLRFHTPIHRASTFEQIKIKHLNVF